MKTMPSACQAIGFTMIEVLGVMAALALVSSVGYVTVANTREAAADVKLTADVESINRSIQVYLSSGGSLDGVADADAVFAKLKTRGDPTRNLGVQGSVLDARMEPYSGDSSSRLRAVWQGAPVNAFVIQQGTAGVSEFRLNEVAAAGAATVEVRAGKELASSGWVWDSVTSSTVEAAGSAVGTTTGVTPVPGTPASTTLGVVSLAQLSPPTFSPDSGTSALAGFPQSVTISNSNPTGTSQVYYSVAGGAYTLYTAPVSVSPGLLSAVAVTLDPTRYTSSPAASATYLAQINLTWTTSANSFTYAQITDATADTASVGPAGAGYSIRYTTDGTTPTAGSSLYAGPITLTSGSWSSASLTLNAIAISSSPYYVTSPVASATLTATPTALSAPTISPGSQVVFGSLSGTITKAAADPIGTSIYFTTNGTAPSVVDGIGTLGGTFTISNLGLNETKTVKAISSAPAGLGFWFRDSGVASVSYRGLNFDYFNIPGVLIGGGYIHNRASLNGSVVIVSVDGVQPNVHFGENSDVVGDVYAPGTPTVNGIAASRIINLDGDPSPSNYTIQVDNNAVLGTVYRRITPVTMPSVSLPTDLVNRGTISSGVALPGRYTNVNPGNNQTVTIGIVGATTPSQYLFDAMSTGNGARIIVQGPVVITLNPGTGSTAGIRNNAIIGNSAHPEWLQINVYQGNLLLENGSALYGSVLDPHGTVTFENGALFTGGVAAKYLDVSNTSTGIVFSLPPPTN